MNVPNHYPEAQIKALKKALLKKESTPTLTINQHRMLLQILRKAEAKSKKEAARLIKANKETQALYSITAGG